MYDGSNADAPLVGKYCGTKTGFIVQTSGNVAYLRFVSDDIIAKTGFSATWAGRKNISMQYVTY